MGETPGDVEALLRLVVAGLLAAFLGIERELHGRPAGIRTHILVAIGACLLTMVSFAPLTVGQTADPSRLAAAVVTGIGFIGAGAILRHGDSVMGLTTAASLWVAASVGVAVGAGWYFGGVAAAAGALVALLVLGWVERRWSKRSVLVRIDCWDTPDAEGRLRPILERYGASGDEVRISRADEDGVVRIGTVVQGDRAARRMIADLSELPVVISATTHTS